jgi:hypothetical protein
MIFFKSRTRKKVEYELMKLYKEIAEINVEKRKVSDYDSNMNLILRKWQIEHDIELYKKLL